MSPPFRFGSDRAEDQWRDVLRNGGWTVTKSRRPPRAIPRLSAEESSRPRAGASDRERVRLVLMNEVAGVLQAREDILTHKARIIREDLRF